MNRLNLKFETEEHLQAWGAQVAEHLPRQGLIFLQGDLGAGKTSLTRALLRGLGYLGHVKSPTFTLVESYILPTRILYHFDLYRINDPEELMYMGIRDYFDEALCLVEWPEKGQGQLGTPDLLIQLTIISEGRSLTLTALSAPGHQVLEQIALL